MNRPIMVLCVAGALATASSGCAQQKTDAGAAAAALAEAIYPGQLQVLDTRTRVGFDYGQDVVLSIRNDPVARIRLQVDKDPADCHVGTPCETRLRQAYDFAVAEAAELRALERAFKACGTPLLAVSDINYRARPNESPTYTARPVVALPLAGMDRTAATARLQACVTRLGAERADTPWAAHDAVLNVRVVSAVNGRATAAPALALDTAVPAALRSRPAYALPIRLQGAAPEAGDWRFDPFPELDTPLKETLTVEASRYIASQRLDARLPPAAAVRSATVDPDRLDLVHAEVRVCSDGGRSARGPCRSDMTARLTHDLTTGRTTVVGVTPDA